MYDIPYLRNYMVAPSGLEPELPFGKQIFIPLRLQPPPEGVRGLDYPFNIVAICNLSCGPSSLYTFPPKRAWLGIATSLTCEVSPNLSRSTLGISTKALNFSAIELLRFKSVVSTYSTKGPYS